DRFSPDTRIEISDDALDALNSYDWPGNVRELENAIEQMVILRHGDRIESKDLPAKIRSERISGTGSVVNLPAEGYPLAELEKEAVLQALQMSSWNQTRAAELLHIPRHTLLYRLEKYDLKKRNKQR
ncbi:MAG: DNA-binding response regulator, partial [Desulfuromonas sp.]